MSISSGDTGQTKFISYFSFQHLNNVLWKFTTLPYPEYSLYLMSDYVLCSYPIYFIMYLIFYVCLYVINISIFNYRNCFVA